MVQGVLGAVAARPPGASGTNQWATALSARVGVSSDSTAS
jgi:hypothetical protein